MWYSITGRIEWIPMANFRLELMVQLIFIPFHIFEAYILFTFGTGYRVRNVKSIWYTAYCVQMTWSFPFFHRLIDYFLRFFDYIVQPRVITSA